MKKRWIAAIGGIACISLGLTLGLTVGGGSPKPAACNHPGCFGAKSSVADPKPGPAMISPKLKLASYSTITGASVPQSERIQSTMNLPDGITLSPSTANPGVSQQEAVTAAAEQGIPAVSYSGEQPQVLFGQMTDAYGQTVAPPQGVVTSGTVPAPSPSPYVNYPVWAIIYTGLCIAPNPGGVQSAAATTTTSSPPTCDSTLYIFTDAKSGNYLFASGG
jgi:hypothetical protein